MSEMSSLAVDLPKSLERDGEPPGTLHADVTLSENSELRLVIDTATLDVAKAFQCGVRLGLVGAEDIAKLGPYYLPLDFNSRPPAPGEEFDTVNAEFIIRAAALGYRCTGLLCENPPGANQLIRTNALIGIVTTIALHHTKMIDQLEKGIRAGILSPAEAHDYLSRETYQARRDATDACAIMISSLQEGLISSADAAEILKAHDTAGGAAAVDTFMSANAIAAYGPLGTTEIKELMTALKDGVRNEILSPDSAYDYLLLDNADERRAAANACSTLVRTVQCALLNKQDAASLLETHATPRSAGLIGSLEKTLPLVLAGQLTDRDARELLAYHLKQYDQVHRCPLDPERMEGILRSTVEYKQARKLAVQELMEFFDAERAKNPGKERSADLRVIEETLLNLPLASQKDRDHFDAMVEFHKMALGQKTELDKLVEKKLGWGPGSEGDASPFLISKGHLIFPYSTAPTGTPEKMYARKESEDGRSSLRRDREDR